MYMLLIIFTCQSLQDSTIVEFRMEFRLEHGSTEWCGIVCFGMENRRKSDFTWYWGKKYVFRAQSFHF